MMHQLRLFFTALQFFTRLPIPGWVGFDPAWLNQASRYFPLVGVVVALITGGAMRWPRGSCRAGRRHRLHRYRHLRHRRLP
jgi:cobalamin synthase